MSKSMGDQGPRIAHLVHKGKGGLAGEVADVRSDVDLGVSRLEGRDASLNYPELDWLDDGTTLLAAGGDIVLEGRNLLGGQSFDELDIDSVYGLVLTALKPGDSELEIQIISGAATDVTLNGNVVEITFNDGVDDDDAIATAINADAADTDGVLRATSSGTQNAAAWTAAGEMAATPLVGGEGEGFEVMVSGVEALPANTTGTTGAAAVDDGTATVTVPDLTSETPARAAGDIVGITIKTNGVITQQLSGVLA